jgi:hypothetical protein
MHCEFLGIDHPGWPERLSRLGHDLYHRPEYARLEAHRLGATPEAFAAGDGDRLFFIPYLIRSCETLFPGAGTGVSDVVSPYGYPGLLVNEAGRDPEFLRAALSALREGLCRRGICSAFFRLHPILCQDFQALFPPETFVDQGETVAMDLSLDEGLLWKQIRETHRAAIRKCERRGFVPRFVPLVDVLEEFLEVYRQTMDRVNAHDAYYFSRDYFTELARLPGVHCCVMNYQGTVAAACVFFECQGIVQAHLGGTRDEFLRLSPFTMTLQQASLWAKRRGNRWLHLGGGVGGADDKLLHFKRGFSSVRFHFLTARSIFDEAKYRELVELRARADDTTAEAILASDFFPAYRTAS